MMYAKIVIAATALLYTLNIHAQLSPHIETDVASQQDLVGKVKRADLQTDNFGKSFLNEYQSYQVSANICNEIKNRIYRYDILIVMATWCHDSKEQVPRFYKILDRIDYATSEIEIICVDREKKAGEWDISSLMIERVPTFIIYLDGNEVGRIVETPTDTLEKDLLRIISL